jgi:rhomboid protease GluP
MDAQAFFGGEYFRAITALTLHADFGHLASNLLAGLFFAHFLRQHGSLGWQFFWVLSSASLANMAVALTLGEHRSLGFSTATFAMLGLLSAREFLLQRRESHAAVAKRWIAPLAGGILMTAATGLGPETDILAHVYGALAGFLLGLMAQPWKPRWNFVASLFSVMAYGGAWLWAWSLY